MRSQIQDPAGRLSSIPLEVQSVYFRVEIARTRIEELTGPLVSAAIWQAPDNVNLRNNFIPLRTLAISDDAQELAGLQVVLGLLEKSGEYAHAVTVMEPLLAQVDADLAEIEARRKAESEALVAEREATGHAQAKALAAVEKDPAVLKARAALAALQPAPAPVDPAILKAREIAAATPRLGEPLGELATAD